MADSIPQLTWIAEPNGDIVWYNQRWYEFTGTTPEDMFGWGWQKVHNPEALPNVLDRWKESLATGAPFEMEFPLRSANGTFRWFLTRVTPFRNAQGRIVRWFGTNTDIDELRQAQSELQRANEGLKLANSDLEQFAYSASHDLKEPLRNVVIYCEMISREYGRSLNAKGQEYLVGAVQSARRMDSLVNDLLAFTQAGVDTFDTEIEKTDASEALERAIANLSTTIAELHAQVTHELLPVVRMRRMHLEQLFQNLISNALKYRSHHPTRIEITSRLQDGICFFSVIDNGIGISAEYQERIFGLFKRLHTSDRYSGTGIGLAICKRIVERYGGRLWVESQPGHGATFVFTARL